MLICLIDESGELISLTCLMVEYINPTIYLVVCWRSCAGSVLVCVLYGLAMPAGPSPDFSACLMLPYTGSLGWLPPPGVVLAVLFAHHAELCLLNGCPSVLEWATSKVASSASQNPL